jgi:spore coat protein U-like protein
MRRQILAPVTAGVLLALAGAAQAATKTTTFVVTANVLENCTIAAGDLDFGDWTGDVDVAAQSTITVNCTAGTDYVVNLSGGTTTNNVLDREMAGAGPVHINYNLYTDAAHLNLWGNGAGGTFNLGGNGGGMGVAQQLLVRGQLLASANVGLIEAGGYSDTVTATIVY